MHATYNAYTSPSAHVSGSTRSAVATPTSAPARSRNGGAGDAAGEEVGREAAGGDIHDQADDIANEAGDAIIEMVSNLNSRGTTPATAAAPPPPPNGGTGTGCKQCTRTDKRCAWHKPRNATATCPAIPSAQRCAKCRHVAAQRHLRVHIPREAKGNDAVAYHRNNGRDAPH